MKRLSPSGITSNGVNGNRQKLNMTAQMDQIKRNANRRVQEQKRDFNKRSSEKQIIEERRKRREARIIETKVRNGRRAEINAQNRARKAEAAKNREYENKKRVQLKANINSQRVKSLEKSYANLKTKTANTLNKYTLQKKLAFTQLGNSRSNVKALGKKLKGELGRLDIERSVSEKLQSNLNAVTLKVEKSQQRIKEIEEERGALNTRIRDLQSRLEMQAKSGSVPEVARLTKELNEAKTKTEALTNEVTTLINSTKVAVVNATKEFNTKLAQAVKNKNNAVIASNAANKKAALSEAKYKAARSEMNSKNDEKTRRELNSKLRKRVKLNALLTNIGVTNKTVLMNEYNSAIKNGKDPNETIDKIVKEARLFNKEAARTSAALAATTIAKISMQSELNDIRTQKEEALAKAAKEKNAAVAEAGNAARKAAMAETATEKATAEQNLKNARAKISAANANKAQALTNAKTERNTALAEARKKANLELQNKNAALMGAASNARAAKEELNAIRFQKEAALAKAATEKISAVAAAEKAAREKASAQTAIERAEADKKLKNAQTKINAASANKTKALENAKTERNAALKRAMNNKQRAVNGLRTNRNLKLKNKNAETRNAQAKLNTIRKEKENAFALANIEKKKAVALAEEAAKAKAAANTLAEKTAAEKKAVEARRIQEEAAAKIKAASNKAREARAKIDEKLRAKAQQARNAVAIKTAKIAKARKIMATYKGTNPFRKYTLAKQGEAAIKEFENGKLIDIENRITELVRYAKTGNAEFDEGKRIARQTANATKQFEERKEKARLERIEIQKREGKQVAVDRTLAQFKANAMRSKNAMANKKAINAMKDASNKKVVSNLVSGALTKAVKSGPVSTIYQSTTNVNRRMVKDEVDKKVETKGYKVVWGAMIDLDGKDKTNLVKIESKLNKKYTLKQGIQQLPDAAFRKGRVPGSGVAARTSLLTQVMRPYIGGGDKYDEHKKQYNNAFKVYKNPAFGNTRSTKVNGIVTANNVMISMKRAPVPPVAMARAAQRNMNIRRAAEGAAVSAKAYVAKNTRPRYERRVDNRDVLKVMKKKVKKENPSFSPARVNAEARQRLRSK